MEKFKTQQWPDFKGRFQNYCCPFCKHQALNFSEPHFDNLSGKEIVAITCSNCAHISFFDASTVASIANEIDKDCRNNNWR